MSNFRIRPIKRTNQRIKRINKNKENLISLKEKDLLTILKNWTLSNNNPRRMMIKIRSKIRRIVSQKISMMTTTTMTLGILTPPKIKSPTNQSLNQLKKRNPKRKTPLRTMLSQPLMIQMTLTLVWIQIDMLPRLTRKKVRRKQETRKRNTTLIMVYLLITILEMNMNMMMKTLSKMRKERTTSLKTQEQKNRNKTPRNNHLSFKRLPIKLKHLKLKNQNQK